MLIGTFASVLPIWNVGLKPNDRLTAAAACTRYADVGVVPDGRSPMSFTSATIFPSPVTAGPVLFVNGFADDPLERLVHLLQFLRRLRTHVNQHATCLRESSSPTSRRPPRRR